MYDMIKGIGPDIYNFQQCLNANLENHDLRSVASQPNNLRLPPQSSVGNKHSFPNLAPTYWNEISDDTKASDSRKRFKKEIKEMLLSNYQEKCICTNPLCVDGRFH